jgi:hypothetical protein
VVVEESHGTLLVLRPHRVPSEIALLIAAVSSALPSPRSVSYTVASKEVPLLTYGTVALDVAVDRVTRVAAVCHFSIVWDVCQPVGT